MKTDTNAKKIIGIVFLSVFIAYILFGFLSNFGLALDVVEANKEKEFELSEFADGIKTTYLSDITGKNAYVNLNGWFAKITGRDSYNDIARLNNGMLTYGSLPELDMNSFVPPIAEFDSYLEEKGIEFVYFQAPVKADIDDTLVKYGTVNNGNKNANKMVQGLTEAGVSVVDLRETITKSPELVEKYFYKTDHHWNTHGAFVGFVEIYNYLKLTFNDQDFDDTVANPDNWNKTTYEGWFLGSHGKRVGQYYAGVDDLTVYTPKFETSMSRFVPKYRTYYGGDFVDANVVSSYLDKPDYFDENPYCVYIGGDYPLVQHRNELAPNDLKVLLLKDSFSLPMQTFLSTAVSELDVLDPRYFNEMTIAEYVEISNPDVVLMLVNPSVFVNKTYAQFGIDKALVHEEEKEELLIKSLPDLRLEAPEDKEHFLITFTSDLERNKKYVFRASDVKALAGNAECVTLALYDVDSGTVISSYAFNLDYCKANDEFEWTFLTPEKNGGKIRLLLYAGMPSDTGGNTVVFENPSLYEMTKP